MDINNVTDFTGEETAKALENFAFSDERIDADLIRTMAMVKLAAARVNARLGWLDAGVAAAIGKACNELIEGRQHGLIKCDPYQGGAGTSLNMNINEAVAHLAQEFLSASNPAGSAVPGVDSLDHVNLHQSTNDVFPTAVKVAVLIKLKALDDAVAILQEALQEKERAFADILKTGRTELQDAVPMTLGMEFGAWAEAIARDRWRVAKSRERIKTVNLGGTAIGTGLGAPRDYIFAVANELKQISGLSVSRGENLVDHTQNLDSVAEVSAISKVLGVNLLKMCGDLKLLSSGPNAGLGEIRLPELQKGSSIMPGKVNPVMPEAVSQIALKAINDDNLTALAASQGQLELNAFLPLIAHTLLGNLDRLAKACVLLANRCVKGIQPIPEACLDGVQRSGALATFLLPVLGYDTVEGLVRESRSSGKTLRELVLEQGLMNAERFDALMNPRRMYKLGFSPEDYQGDEQ